MIMLMSETEQVNLPRVNPKVWAQGWVDELQKTGKYSIKTQTYMAQEKTEPSPSGGLVGCCPYYTGPN